MRRPPRFPYLTEEKPILGAPRPCECCEAQATFTLKIERSANAPESSLFVCDKHLNLARRRKFECLAQDQDRKIDKAMADAAEARGY